MKKIQYQHLVDISGYRRRYYAVVSDDAATADVITERELTHLRWDNKVFYDSSDEYYVDKFLADFGEEKIDTTNVTVGNSLQGFETVEATVISPKLWERMKEKEYPVFMGNAHTYVVPGIGTFTEAFTCNNGYHGTCGCFSHPRKLWTKEKEAK